MTKKDYELIASVLSQARFVNKTASDTRVWERICLLYASALATTNPRFDRDKFLQACGIETAFEQQEREDSEEFHHYANLEQ